MTLILLLEIIETIANSQFYILLLKYNIYMCVFVHINCGIAIVCHKWMDVSFAGSNQCLGQGLFIYSHIA
jgi:hypothetical protein